MAENPMIRIVDDCILRLQNGQTIADCLRIYPQYRDDLAPLLEAGMLYRRIQVSDAEVMQSQRRVQARFEQALAPPSAPIIRIPRFFWLAAATVMLIALMTGTTLAAQSSIPGDVLYPVKRISETIVLILPGDTDTRRNDLNQRRIDEIQQLLTIGREAQASFSGEIMLLDETRLLVAGLPVERTAQTQVDGELISGIRVQIDGHTTDDGRFIAERIRSNSGDNNLIPIEPTGIPSIRIPAIMTETPIMTITSALIVTSRPTLPPTYTYTPQVRATQTPALIRPSMTPTTPPDNERPTETNTLRVTATPGLRDNPTEAATCTLLEPEGWIRYTIQSGDTLSGLAVRANTTIEQLQRVNCIENPRLIVVGTQILLPVPPSSPATAIPARTAIPATNPPAVRPTDVPAEQRPPQENPTQAQRDNPPDARPTTPPQRPTATPGRRG